MRGCPDEATGIRGREMRILRSAQNDPLVGTALCRPPSPHGYGIRNWKKLRDNIWTTFERGKRNKLQPTLQAVSELEESRSMPDAYCLMPERGRIGVTSETEKQEKK